MALAASTGHVFSDAGVEQAVGAPHDFHEPLFGRRPFLRASILRRILIEYSVLARPVDSRDRREIGSDRNWPQRGAPVGSQANLPKRAQREMQKFFLMRSRRRLSSSSSAWSSSAAASSICRPCGEPVNESSCSTPRRWTNASMQLRMTSGFSRIEIRLGSFF